jgi:hypothetical protein
MFENITPDLIERLDGMAFVERILTLYREVLVNNQLSDAEHDILNNTFKSEITIISNSISSFDIDSWSKTDTPYQEAYINHLQATAIKTSRNITISKIINE